MLPTSVATEHPGSPCAIRTAPPVPTPDADAALLLCAAAFPDATAAAEVVFAAAFVKVLAVLEMAGDEEEEATSLVCLA